MPSKRKPHGAARRPKSRRLETRSAGPTVPVVRSGRKLLLPHERDEAAIPEPRRLVRHNRTLVEQAARDVEHGLIDTESRGVPSNVPSHRKTNVSPSKPSKSSRHRR